MSLHLFVGGTRHLNPPSTGYDTDTMTLVIDGQGPPPYLTERYVRTDHRLDVGDDCGPMVVYVLDGQGYNREALTHLLDGFMAEHGPRIREHAQFLRTGVGRRFDAP